MEDINTKFIHAEYQYYVEEANDTRNGIDWNKLAELLCTRGEWTRQGAEVLVKLAQNYGSFILKSAFVLAVVTNIEDGELGL